MLSLGGNLRDCPKTFSASLYIPDLADPIVSLPPEMQ